MKIRVLEVVPTLLRAGAENVVSYLAAGLDRKEFQAAVVSLYDPDPRGLEPVLREHGIPMWHLGKRRGFDPRMYLRLRHVVRQFQPDVIHSHCYVLRYLLHLSGPAMVHTVHNIASAEVDALGRVFNRWAFRHGIVPVAVGAAVADSFRKMYGFPPPSTIPNGIDIERFRRPEARSAWRRANGFGEKDLLIVSTGRLTAQKNPLALASAIADIPGAQLLLAGEGILRQSLEGRERVHLLGLRKDIPDVLAAADIFALASDWEGLPLALIEAMAAGLPAVATDVGSVSEVIEHGLTGLLVQRGDQRALTAALQALTSDPVRRREMGVAACSRVQRFSADSMVRSYEELFARLVKRPSGGPPIPAERDPLTIAF